MLTNQKLQVSAISLPLAGHNDSDAEIDTECAWIAEHLGRDVPLHFTAFHPDYKMRDVARTAFGTASTSTNSRRVAGSAAMSS